MRYLRETSNNLKRIFSSPDTRDMNKTMTPNLQDNKMDDLETYANEEDPFRGMPMPCEQVQEPIRGCDHQQRLFH